MADLSDEKPSKNFIDRTNPLRQVLNNILFEQYAQSIGLTPDRLREHDKWVKETTVQDNAWEARQNQYDAGPRPRTNPDHMLEEIFKRIVAPELMFKDIPRKKK